MILEYILFFAATFPKTTTERDDGRAALCGQLPYTLGANR